eukprot:gene23152-29345_t
MNDGKPVVIDLPQPADDLSHRHLQELLNGSPNGGTPLCEHIKAVVKQITKDENRLRANGQRALLVIATDGEASDGKVAVTMRPLKHLPDRPSVHRPGEHRELLEQDRQDLELNMDVVDDLGLLRRVVKT